MSATYPVWIGSLAPDAQETHLLETFNTCGPIASVRVIRDGNGRSKKFGFINFHSLRQAEMAAEFGQRALVNGRQVVVKGPRELQKDGHYKSSVDYRPLTDCLFFMEKGGCSNRDSCPYRHCNEAKYSQGVCHNWMKKKCSNKRCPLKHPGSKAGLPKPHKQQVRTAQHVRRRSKQGKIGSNVVMAPSRSPDPSDAFVEGLSQGSSATYDEESSHSELSSDESADTDDFSGFEGDEEPYSSQYSGEVSVPVGITVASDNDSSSGAVRSNSSSLSGSFSNMRFRELQRGAGTLNGELEDVIKAKGLSKKKKKHSGLGDSWGRRHGNTSSETSSCGSPESDDIVNKHHKSHKTSVTDQIHSNVVNTENSEEFRSLLLPPVGNEPVGVFWDIENCSVPQDKSAFSVAQKIRKVFFDSKREAEFICVCDTMKENSDVTDGLNNAQVTVVHVSAVAKNAADDKLRAAMRKFAHNFQPPATVVLISGDINFASELSDLRDRHSFNIVLVHNTWCKEEFKAFAHQTYLWEDFVDDVEKRKTKASHLPTEVVVKNLPPHISRFKVRERLSMLSGNCGGKVVQVQTTSAIVRFATPELTIRAQKRMSGQDVFGNTIAVEMASQLTPRAPPQSRYPPPPLPPNSQYPPIVVEPQETVGVVPYLDNSPVTNLASLPPGTGRVVVHHIVPSGSADDIQVLKRLRGELAQMAVCAQPPVIVHSDIVLLWESVDRLCAVVTVDVHKTAHARKDWSLLQASGSLAPSLARLTVDLRSATVRNNWQVTIVNTYEEDLEDKITRSHVVHVMKQYEHGWAKLKDFRSHYTSAFELPCQEVDLQSAAGEIVQLIGPVKRRVIILHHCSPLVRVSKKPSVAKRIVRLVESKGKVNLLSLVSLYEKMYGPLPYNKDGTELSNILTELPLQWTIDKKDITNTFISIQTAQTFSSQGVSDEVPSESAKRSVFFEECLELLREHGGAIFIKEVQPLYQTKYKRSPRLSDYGAGNIRDLLKMSPLFKLSDDEKIVMLINSESSTVTPALGGPQPMLTSKKDFFKCCLNLLKNHGGQVPTSKFQQYFQTEFHISPKVSEYGASTMKELLLQCPSIMIKGKHYHLNEDQPSDCGARVDQDHLKKRLINLVAGQPTRALQLSGLDTAYQNVYKESLYSCLPPKSLTMDSLAALCVPELELTCHLEEIVLQFSPKWLEDRIKIFSALAVDIISKKPDHFVMCDKFAQEFVSHTGHQLVLLDYGFKKLSAIFERIKDVVAMEEAQVANTDAPVAVLRLVQEKGATKKERPSSGKSNVVVEEHISLGSVRRDMEYLVYTQPGHMIQMVYFRPAFEKMFNSTLDYKGAGHGKLLTFLKSFEKSFVLSGEGPTRNVHLHKNALLAMNMFTIVRASPSGVEMSDLAQLYGKKFELLTMKDFGYKKLLNLLQEEVGDLVEIHGTSPVRRIYLQEDTLYSGGMSDEVALSWQTNLKFDLAFLLYNASEHRLSCSELEKQYLSCFGKKMSALCGHFSRTVPDLIIENTPLKVDEDPIDPSVQLLLAHAFACEMAEIASLHSSDISMAVFKSAFQEQFKRPLKPQSYNCRTFDEVLGSAKEYMEKQLQMKEDGPYIIPSTLSSIFALLGKVWKDELKKKSISSDDVSSTLDDVSESGEVEMETKWPSFSSDMSTEASGGHQVQEHPKLSSPDNLAPSKELTDTLGSYKKDAFGLLEGEESEILKERKIMGGIIQPAGETVRLPPENKQPSTGVCASSHSPGGLKDTSKCEPSSSDGLSGGKMKHKGMRKKKAPKLAINFGPGPLISSGSGPLISSGSGTVVSGGSGPLISSGSGPLISSGSGTVVSGGSGPLISSGSGSNTVPYPGHQPPAVSSVLPPMPPLQDCDDSD